MVKRINFKSILEAANAHLIETYNDTDEFIRNNIRQGDLVNVVYNAGFGKTETGRGFYYDYKFKLDGPAAHPEIVLAVVVIKEKADGTASTKSDEFVGVISIEKI